MVIDGPFEEETSVLGIHDLRKAIPECGRTGFQ